MIKGHVISVFAMNFTYSLVTAVFRTEIKNIIKWCGVCSYVLGSENVSNSSFAGAVRSNSPLTVCDVCRPIYGCGLDHQQIKADTVSSGPALAGSTPAQTDCWSMAVTRPSRSHSSGTCCWRTHVELRMSNSDFNCNKWSRFVIIQIFGEGIITCHRCHCCFVSPFVLRLVYNH